MIELSVKQGEALEILLDSETYSLGYGGGAGGGKSWIIVTWLVTQSLRYAGVRSFIGQKELKRLKQSTLNTFFEFCSTFGLSHKYTYNQQDSVIRFSNGSEIYLLDLAHQPSDPLYNRFGSLEFTFGCIDESQEVTETCAKILQTRCGRQKNKLYGLQPKVLETFNPDKGHVYRRFYEPWSKGEMLEGVKFIRSLAVDNPWLDKSYKEMLQRQTGATYERLWLGNFEYDDDPSLLMSIEAVRDMRTNRFETKKTRYISGDLAGLGDDKTVLYVFEGGPDGIKLLDLRVMAKNDEQEFKNALDELKVKWGVRNSHIVLDEGGQMMGVQHFAKGCYGYKGNRAPEKQKGKDKPYFKDLDAQCAAMIASMVNRGLVDMSVMPPDKFELLYQEMVQLKQKNAGDGLAFQIVPKKLVKQAIGRSPDYWDALKQVAVFLLKPKKTLYHAVI